MADTDGGALTNLLVTDGELAERRGVVGPGGPLNALPTSLAADLEPLMDRDPYFPAEKALLSREGGRCSRDGSLLDFDPFRPHEHRCPRCGSVYRGELHDRFWIYWYQLWLAERAVHAAALSTLGVDGRFAALAEAILRGYAERYASYPNVDNVLGPARLFFSTYLESIWLLQICVAVDLLDRREAALGAEVRERIVAPSRAIILQYDEGGSNRQVWNDVALLAAARLLDDGQGAQDAVYGPSGLVSHLERGLLADGTWFEGENYHLFAHRGLWYGVTMAEVAGLELPEVLVERFQRGFSAPFMTALPDFTLPSRRDSQYAISLRQWRIAEHCELGLARADDPTLVGALDRMYGDDVPRRDTGRHTSSADVERNVQPSALSRADLSWRALLRARPTLPELEASPPQSALLPHQGIAVFRRDAGRIYVALDYGHSGGGHGHPDRLNLLLAVGATRWLDDFGTGSYVDPTLHWYRSTLAHNAPLAGGRSQAPVDGSLTAHDEGNDGGWIMATAAIAAELSPETTGTRRLIVMPSYAIDEVEWHSDAETTLDLPLHVDLAVNAGAGAPANEPLAGGSGIEDGFAFAHDTSYRVVEAAATVQAHAVADAQRLDVWVSSDAGYEWWRAVAPGAPGRGDHAFVVLRSREQTGRYRMLWSWEQGVADVHFESDTVRVVHSDGTVHAHRRTTDGWCVDVTQPGGTVTECVVLGGERTLNDVKEPPSVEAASNREPITLSRNGRPVLLEMAESNYRRSEQSWREAGAPTATVGLSWTGRSLRIDIDVPRSSLTFAPASAVNPYDNEAADVNGDGIQLYVRTGQGMSGWMLVPEPGSIHVRARMIDGWTTPLAIEATWERSGNGYRAHIAVASGTLPEGIDVIVNEMPVGRERRRGQLLLSGGQGDFVYLRGDRHDVARLIPLRLAND